MTATDIPGLPSRPPDAKFSYGSDARQYAELRLPDGPGPFPVVVIFHGGCYGDYADAGYTAPIATALTKEGWATWNVEYRREHEPGGGWPGTFLDAAHAVDSLRSLAGPRGLLLDRVVLTGHSAGGQLALWAAARNRVPPGSEAATQNPLPVRGAVSLAGIIDMRAFAEYGRQPCGERHLRVMGGAPDRYPQRYAAVSPAELLPLGVPYTLVWGEDDTVVPRRLFRDFEQKAAAAGDRMDVITLPGQGHHDMCVPGGAGWKSIVDAIRKLLNGR